MLIDLSPPSAAPIHVAEIATQLRLPTAHAEDPDAQARLGRLFQIALRIIEARIGRALVQRMFIVRAEAWAIGGRLLLPIAPVKRVDSLAVISADGDRTMLDADMLRLDVLADRPTVTARPPHRLPPIPRNGHVEAVIEAGYGPDWEAVPPELRHACILLAAAIYDQPWSETAEVLPRNVLALLEPWRRMRL